MVADDGLPHRVTGSKRAARAAAIAASSHPWPSPWRTSTAETWPSGATVIATRTAPEILAARASGGYAGVGFDTGCGFGGGSPQSSVRVATRESVRAVTDALGAGAA